MVATADQAVRTLLLHTEISQGYCLWYCRMAWGCPGGPRDAAAQWDSTIKHTNLDYIPHGAPGFWLGGSKGHGHVALWDRNVMQWASTDAPRAGYVGHVPFDWPQKYWGLHFVGWGSSLGGVSIPLAGKPAPAPTPKPTPVPASAPVVSLLHIRSAILRDRPAPQGSASNKTNSLPVERALNKVAGLPARLVDGSLGTSSFGPNSAYQRWQVHCGFRGAGADGYPPTVLTGRDSFSLLARASGSFRPAA